MLLDMALQARIGLNACKTMKIPISEFVVNGVDRMNARTAEGGVRVDRGLRKDQTFAPQHLNITLGVSNCLPARGITLYIAAWGVSWLISYILQKHRDLLFLCQLET